jgi:sterol desaturase/sphingolipid hydroxylase (fatty acid hydroxylase superfamily)
MTNPTIIAVPVFALLIAIEAYASLRKRNDEFSEPKDTWNNILIGLFSLVFGAIFGLAIGILYEWSYSVSPLRFPADAWWSWVILFFIDDFAYYWFHRISHESRFLWNFHVVHHSSKHYNLSVAVRQSWFSGLTHWIFYIPIMFLGFAPWMFLTMHGLNLIYQFWIHTRLIGKLGIFEKFLNTPSHHRVHHGINEEYLDKNYAGVLIIWDRMFGTYAEEKAEPRYGILKQLDSHNPLWANLHGWVELWNRTSLKEGVGPTIKKIFGSPYRLG